MDPGQARRADGGPHGVLPWSAVKSVVETAEQFVLVSAKEPTRFVAYLPKRAIDDPAAVQAFLAGKLRSA